MKWFLRHIFLFTTGTSLILMMIGNMQGKELAAAFFGFLALCSLMLWIYEMGKYSTKLDLSQPYDRTAYYQARRRQIRIIKGGKR